MPRLALAKLVDDIQQRRLNFNHHEVHRYNNGGSFFKASMYGMMDVFVFSDQDMHADAVAVPFFIFVTGIAFR